MTRPVPTLYKKVDDAQAFHKTFNGAGANVNDNLAGAVWFGREIKNNRKDKDRDGTELLHNQ